MAAPTPYALAYDFTAFQTSNPTTPLPADKIEIEYNALQTTTDEIIANLGLIQKTDGTLANNSVGNDQLKDEVVIGLNAATGWVTSTAYAVNDTVYHENRLYKCLVAHTSGTFATDLAALKWEEILNFNNLAGVTSSNLTSVSGVDTITASGDISAYVTGQIIHWVASDTNTGAVTINIDSLGAKSIQRGASALVAGEITSGRSYLAVYDGTVFQLVNSSGSTFTQTLLDDTNAGSAFNTIAAQGGTIGDDVTIAAEKALIINGGADNNDDGVKLNPGSGNGVHTFSNTDSTLRHQYYNGSSWSNVWNYNGTLFKFSVPVEVKATAPTGYSATFKADGDASSDYAAVRLINNSSTILGSIWSPADAGEVNYSSANGHTFRTGGAGVTAGVTRFEIDDAGTSGTFTAPTGTSYCTAFKASGNTGSDFAAVRFNANDGTIRSSIWSPANAGDLNISGGTQVHIRAGNAGVSAGTISGTFGASSVQFPTVGTTAAAANAYLNNAASNSLLRSTSSRRYKKDVEDIDTDRVDNVINGLRPIWYRSLAKDDREDWGWYGLVAEEAAEIEPALVHWAYPEKEIEEDIIIDDGVNKKGEPKYKKAKQKKIVPDVDAELRPDGVQYERLTVFLLNKIKRMDAEQEKMREEINKLKGVGG